MTDEVPPIGDGEPFEPLPSEYSEDVLAKTMAERHRDDLRFVKEWGKWFRWSGTYWRADKTNVPFDLARQVCREVAATVAERESLSVRLASAKTRAAVVSLVADDPRIASTAEQWDADPWILNTPGGVVELRTGTLRENRPLDYCTRITLVAPGGECPLWLDHIRRVTLERGELAEYLQRLAGYCLTGVTFEQALFFFHGSGSNGKSKFIEAVIRIMNTYHQTAQIETFTEKRGESHPTELASLAGARLVTSVETEEGRHWAESRIKMLTGGDRIQARFMRKDFFEFDPQFKLLIIGNKKPGLRSVDAAITRRMNLIPWDYKVPDELRNQQFGEVLRAEFGGILQWMIDGCVRWQDGGLRPPEVVLEATANYLEQEDQFKIWFEENCARVDPDTFTPTAWLFFSWRTWAEKAHEFVGTEKRFGQRIEALGFKMGRSRLDSVQKRGFFGVRIIGQEGSGRTDDAPY